MTGAAEQALFRLWSFEIGEKNPILAVKTKNE
jgi:hypothetical protein